MHLGSGSPPAVGFTVERRQTEHIRIARRPRISEVNSPDTRRVAFPEREDVFELTQGWSNRTRRPYQRPGRDDERLTPMPFIGWTHEDQRRRSSRTRSLKRDLKQPGRHLSPGDFRVHEPFLAELHGRLGGLKRRNTIEPAPKQTRDPAPCCEPSERERCQGSLVQDENRTKPVLNPRNGRAVGCHQWPHEAISSTRAESHMTASAPPNEQSIDTRTRAVRLRPTISAADGSKSPPTSVRQWSAVTS